MVNEVIHPNPSQVVLPIGNQILKYMSPRGHSQSITPENKVKIRKIMVTSVFLDEASRSKMMLHQDWENRQYQVYRCQVWSQTSVNICDVFSIHRKRIAGQCDIQCWGRSSLWEWVNPRKRKATVKKESHKTSWRRWCLACTLKNNSKVSIWGLGNST